MQTANLYQLARAWQDAVNRQDSARLEQLTDENIEIVGPRGSAYGLSVLQDWMTRAGATFETLRGFARNDRVVLAQRGTWNSAETGGQDSLADVAAYFRVAGGKVTHYARYDSLDKALRTASLDYEDEVLSNPSV